MARGFAGTLAALVLLVTAARAEAVTVSYYYSTSREISPGGTNAAIANCPSGSYPVGGGWDAGWNVFVYQSYGTTVTWNVAARNTGSDTQWVRAWVACASGNIATSNLTRAAVTLTIPARQAMCADQYGPSCTGVSTAGGFINLDASYPTDLVMYASRWSSAWANQWNMCFYNPSRQDRKVILFAHCVAGIPGLSYTGSQSDAMVLAPGRAGSQYIGCGNGYQNTGAGFFKSVIQSKVDEYSRVQINQNGPSVWGASTIAFNGAGDTALVSTFVRCVSMP